MFSHLWTIPMVPVAYMNDTFFKFSYENLEFVKNPCENSVYSSRNYAFPPLFNLTGRHEELSGTITHLPR